MCGRATDGVLTMAPIRFYVQGELSIQRATELGLWGLWRGGTLLALGKGFAACAALAFARYGLSQTGWRQRTITAPEASPAQREELSPYQKAHADGILDFGEGLCATFFTGLRGETPVVFRKRPWLGDKSPVICPTEELEYAHGYIDGYAKAGERAGGG